MTGQTKRDPRTAVDKAMALLNAFGDEAHLGLGVSELARRAGLSKSTAFRVLAMLEQNGAVERAGTAFRLGPMIQNLGATQESDYLGRVRDAMTPFLADVYDLTRQTVHLAVLQGTEVVYLNKLHGHLHKRMPSRIGGRVPAYCTAVGKVLLSYEPDRVEESISRGLVAWTPNTITDPVAFRREIRHVRTSGLAFDREEITRGLNCIAAPILSGRGKPVAGLSISGPVGRFRPDDYEKELRQVCFAASRAASVVEVDSRPTAGE